MKRYLVLTDIDTIQSYLFSATRLAMISGASRIVVEFDAFINAHARSVGGEALTYSGGSAIVRLDDETVANDFCSRVEREFREASVSGHLTTVGPFGYEESNFKSAVAKAYCELEVKKRLGFLHGESPGHAMARRCTTCGRETASEFAPQMNPDASREPKVAEAANWFGPGCSAKWKARRRRQVDDESNRAPDWIDWLQATPGWSTFDPESHFPHEFADFVGERERLALIVADVNGVGERLLELDESQLKTFSFGLARSLRKALTEAIQKACAPYRTKILKREIFLPLTVLYHGGDDLVIACRAELALPLLRVLTTEFKRQNELPEDDGICWNNGNPLGLSASAVISGRGFPFRTSHRIASRLLTEAKKTVREETRAARDGSSPWQHGAVDFAIVSESYANADSIIADRGKIGTRRSVIHQFQFTGRPYCVGDGTSRDFADILSAARLLRKREFPNTRLHELREICSLEFLSHALKDRDMDDGGTPADVNRVLDYWKTRYGDWLRRTNRNPSLRTVWAEALEHLEAKHGSGLMEADEHFHRTFVGDFAELVGLVKSKHDSVLSEAEEHQPR